ncbi:MAG: RNA methyltransferase [Bacteroidetes bacterium]|nr:RNA methyltransferase [Bacteroidota bacterium]MCK6649746.1 RNA methyltransferase [Bacteroidia bacterium]
MSKELIEYLSQFVSDTRKAKMEQVLENRTRHITIVLEDLYQPHNASAVLRSCDIFGIQDIHIVENSNAYTVNKDIAMGSPKWLNLHKYRKAENNSLDCIQKLKAKGYRIVATSPHKNGYELKDLPVDKPLALVFGTELTGISDTVREHADEFVMIPMYGFTESFNISVSAALCLHSTVERLHQTNVNWHISEEEKEELRLHWLRKSISRVEILEKDFWAKKGMTPEQK